MSFVGKREGGMGKGVENFKIMKEQVAGRERGWMLRRRGVVLCFYIYFYPICDKTSVVVEKKGLFSKKKPLSQIHLME